MPQTGDQIREVEKPSADYSRHNSEASRDKLFSDIISSTVKGYDFASFGDSKESKSNQESQVDTADGKIELTDPYKKETAEAAPPPEATVAAIEAEPLKLEKTKFDESEVGEALKLAKENNLPIAVYTGATWCGYCPDASAKFNQIASDMESGEKTGAIMLKMDYDKAAKLSKGNSEEARALKEFLGDADRIPNVAVYDPANLTTPVADSTVANWGKESMRSHMDRAFEKISGQQKPADIIERRQPEEKQVQTDFNESNFKEAVIKAREAGLPLLTHVTMNGGADQNIARAFKYLNDNNLAVAANIDANKAKGLRSQGLETGAFNALGSAMQAKDGAGSENSFFNSYDPEKILDSMKFGPDQSLSSSDSGAVIEMMKRAGVDLSGSNDAAAVKALLEGREIPEPLSGNVHEANSVEEATRIMKLAREKNLPLVVHAETTICDDQTCHMESLDPTIPEAMKDEAVFMEIPRGGFDPESVKENPELARINEFFKVSPEDHKTEVDVHSFRYDDQATLKEFDLMLKDGSRYFRNGFQVPWRGLSQKNVGTPPSVFAGSFSENW
ncbi:hypothetical protein GC174_16400 [bacterium]|nr:hypothetical protein [bacterium]